jgi:hypothetical protein
MFTFSAKPHRGGSAPELLEQSGWPATQEQHTTCVKPRKAEDPSSLNVPSVVPRDITPIGRFISPL